MPTLTSDEPVSTPRPAVGHRLLTVQEASAETGIPERSLRTLLARRVLPGVRFPETRRFWIDRQDLEAAIEAGKQR